MGVLLETQKTLLRRKGQAGTELWASPVCPGLTHGPSQ